MPFKRGSERPSTGRRANGMAEYTFLEPQNAKASNHSMFKTSLHRHLEMKPYSMNGKASSGEPLIPYPRQAVTRHHVRET